ncbi:inositol monophosphatase [Arachnia propionica]|uniref:Inositol monophosphatase n=1 Tax=Arachnia propionica TaxID=1750 RepID=A0A3P1TD41_9ACTN|nr:inositol monophosphatase [Arachnia propionica]MDO5081844.1 inositol monophosphatase [Arachnia propionica]RRD07304.1 inositol monophosphatase [Arachnia propionica]
METEAILDLMKETAEAVINPRFRALEETDISAKSGPDDLVTIADKEAEAHLTDALRRIYPDALIVGEETVFVDPELRWRIPNADHALVIDPIDGTGNFVRGRAEHGMILAETRGGVTTRGWIWQPQTGRGYTVERGAGVRLNGAPLVAQRPERLPLGAASKRQYHGFTADGELSPVTRTNFSCAFDYPSILHGEFDFVFYSRLHPWDHLAGCLMVTESGGVARTMDGLAYTVSSRSRGLIVASDTLTWMTAQQRWPAEPEG